LLPDDRTAYHRQFTHGRLLLEEVSHPAAEQTARTRRFRPRSWVRARLAHLPWKVFLSHQLAAVYGALAAVVAGLSMATALFADERPWWKNVYLPLLDIFTMGDPATEESVARRVLQLLAGFVGLAVLPLVVAATVNATDAFRTASASHPPDDDVDGHIVLVGLGMVGTRVLDRLHATGHQVVAIERDPRARGVTLARRLGIPLLLEDATEPAVLERARVRQSGSLLVLTRDDGLNLDIVMAVRETNPAVRVVTRLYDDAFAATVQRTLRASYPDALTRSRSVSALAAPSFAAAMMGRHVLGVMPVERGSLLFTCVDVAGHPELEGRSVHEAFRENEWRVLAVGAARGPLPGSAAVDGPDAPHPDRTEFDWRPAQGRVLVAGDRVVLATTRRGLDVLMTGVGSRPPGRRG
jgi:Trk K+ transport system NAD-binding subunit